MANAKQLMYYRGFPLIRSGNMIYYGSGGDEYAAMLTIKGTKVIGDREVPNKIMVQLVPTQGFGDPSKKALKGEFTGFYEALDTAHMWLVDTLFA